LTCIVLYRLYFFHVELLLFRLSAAVTFCGVAAEGIGVGSRRLKHCFVLLFLNFYNYFFLILDSTFYILNNILEKLEAIISKLESKISDFECLDTGVSFAYVGWHIEHSAMVINGIIAELKKSNPTNYVWKFNLSRLVILGINKIPKGKGKAPKQVVPQGIIEPARLKISLENAKKNIAELDKLEANSFFNHPYFGDLNLKVTKKFLLIHTNHHLKIIEDILN